jgi:anti-anti-sigma factor
MGSDSPFTVRIESRNGVARIALSGELNIATVSTLTDRLALVEQDGVGTIMLDLRDLAFVDSTGLHAFLQARDRAKANGHQFLMVGASPFARRLFEVSGTLFLVDDGTATHTLEQFTRGDGAAAALDGQAGAASDV